MKKGILTLATLLFIWGAITLTSCVRDDEAPVITLRGDVIVKIDLGTTYTEPGYTAVDNKDGDVTANVTNNATTVIDNTKAGKYIVTYSVTDEKANAATATREVWVVITPSNLVGNYSCSLNSSIRNEMTIYADTITESSVNDVRCVTGNFDGYSNPIVYFELSGDLGTTVTIPSQTKVYSTFFSKNWLGNGTVNPDGKSIIFDHKVFIYQDSHNYTETVISTYTRQ